MALLSPKRMAMALVDAVAERNLATTMRSLYVVGRPVMLISAAAEPRMVSEMKTMAPEAPPPPPPEPVLTMVVVSNSPSPSASVSVSAMPAPGRRFHVPRCIVFDELAVMVPMPSWMWSARAESVDAPADDTSETRVAFDPNAADAPPPPPLVEEMVRMFDDAAKAMPEPDCSPTYGPTR